MKRRKKPNTRSMLFIIFVLILLVGIGFVQISNAYLDNEKRQTEVVLLEEAIKKEKLNQLELLKTKEEMKTRTYIEATARSKFGLIYPDETVIDTSEKD